MLTSLSLEQAYTETIQFTQRDRPKLRWVTQLLPRDRRVAIWVAYAFFQRLDNLIDKNEFSPDQLKKARDLAARPAAEQTDPVLMAWADVRERYHIPSKWVDDLLDGMALDLEPGRRYATLADLREHCRRVTASIFLILVALLDRRRGVARETAEMYAVPTGMAVQLMDILRDVPEDIASGRCFIPQATLRAYGLTEAELLRPEGRDGRFRKMMQYLVDEARQTLKQGQPMIRCYGGAEWLFLCLGFAIVSSGFDEFERVDYDVFNQRVRAIQRQTAWRLLRHWWRYMFSRA